MSDDAREGEGEREREWVHGKECDDSPNKRIDLIISNKVYFVLDKLANLSA